MSNNEIISGEKNLNKSSSLLKQEDENSNQSINHDNNIIHSLSNSNDTSINNNNLILEKEFNALCRIINVDHDTKIAAVTIKLFIVFLLISNINFIMIICFVDFLKKRAKIEKIKKFGFFFVF